MPQSVHTSMPQSGSDPGTDKMAGFYAGSQDYYNHESLCWPGGVPNGCFENTTGPLQEAVTGLDLHRMKEPANSSQYATILYTDEADAVISGHAAQYGFPEKSTGARVAMSKPMFLYLPHQVPKIRPPPPSPLLHRAAVCERL